MKSESPARPRRTWWRWLLLGVLLLGAGVGALWWYHEALIERGISKGIAAQPTVSGMSLGQPMRLDFFSLRDPEDSRAPVFLVAEDIALDYNWGGLLRGERKFDDLRIGRLTLNLANWSERNYDFVLDLINAPASTFDPLPYVPRAIDIASLALSLETELASLRLENLHVQSTVASISQSNWKVQGDQITGSWRAEQVLPDAQPVSGSMTADLNLGDGRLEGGLQAFLPGLLDVSLSGVAQTSPSLSADLTVAPGSLSGPLWGEMLSGTLRTAIGFDALQIDGGALKLRTSDSGLYAPELSFEVSTSTLRLGEPEAPQYSGPASLKILGGGDAGLVGTAYLRLAETPELALTLSSEAGVYSVALAESNWNRSALEQVLPASLRTYLGLWPGLSQATFAGAVTIQDRYGIEAQVNSESTTGARAQLGLTGVQSSAGLNIEATATQEDAGTWKLAYAQGAEQGQVVSLALEQAKVSPWVEGVLGYPMPDLPVDSLSGTVGYVVKPEDSAPSITLDLKGATSAASGLALKLTGQHELEGNRLTGIGGNLKAGDAIDLDVSKGTMELAPWGYALPIEGSLNLTDMGVLLDSQFPSGVASIAGTLASQASGIALRHAKAELHGFAISDFVLPEEPPLKLAGEVLVETASGVLVNKLELSWGETLEGSFDALQFNSLTDINYGDFTIRGTYALLTALGLFESAETEFAISGEGVQRNGDAYTGLVNGALKGGFVWSEGILAAKDLTLEAKGDLAQALGASGPLVAGEIAALGVVFSNVKSTVRLEWPMVHLDDIEAEVFGGRVKGSARIDLMSPSFPIVVDAEIEDADLSRFTEEFQPPDTELTGLASGTIHAAIEGETITELGVQLTSGEGFTLNRQMVAQILMSQQVGEFTGSGTVSKIVERVIGKEDSRPFTGADLNLGIDGGRITGQAQLKSQALNLTIDIKADQQALLEAMRMRQEGQVGNFEATFN